MDKQLVTIAYKTADGKRICVEVSTAVKELLEQSDRQIRSQQRQDRRRHSEYIDGLTDVAITVPNEDIADLVVRLDSAKELYAAIEKIPATQQRRLYLYYNCGLTCREIAKLEEVHHTTIVRSLESARKVLRNILSK